ncbi:MAG: aminoacyl-tRNA hydrolase [Actinomycetota bacterium]|nr:aminoacyl-tRNA hydrolase [Actinomycetota bacterium]
MQPTWLIIGLGNPGDRYELTPHNAGARAVQLLADRLGAKFKAAKGPAVVAESKRGEARLVIARPTTYMNESGMAAVALCRWYKTEVSNTIVLHDEIDLQQGVLRLKRGGGTAGNHGLDSIVASLGSPDFFRVRIGVGRHANPGVEPADFVLQRMSKGQAEVMAEAEEMAGDAALAIIEQGLERAMNTYNTRGSDRE